MDTTNMSLWIVFLTGLTTGGLSCMAMQGGLLASLMVNQQQDSPEAKEREQWSSLLMFLGSKLVAHIVLGFLLGALGSVVTLGVGARLFFQVLAAVFMLATAFNLLQLHPMFRAVLFTPPKFLQRLIRGTSKSQALFAPGLLGVLTIFIPCGVTQAMEVLAITSGSPVRGALIMGAFVLGTSPLFGLLWGVGTRASEAWQQSFAKFAAAALIAMALYSLNGVLIVLGSPVNFSTLVRPVTYFFSEERFVKNSVTPEVQNGVQQVEIQILNQGYSPRYLRVRQGVPVELTLRSKDTYSCALSFILKEFDIDTFLGATDTQVFTFTPQKTGKYTYTCSMGMYTGVLEVI